MIVKWERSVAFALGMVLVLKALLGAEAGLGRFALMLVPFCPVHPVLMTDHSGNVHISLGGFEILLCHLAFFSGPFPFL